MYDVNGTKQTIPYGANVIMGSPPKYGNTVRAWCLVSLITVLTQNIINNVALYDTGSVMQSNIVYFVLINPGCYLLHCISLHYEIAIILTSIL